LSLYTDAFQNWRCLEGDQLEGCPHAQLRKMMDLKG
jgi:hypothetical protein